MKKFYSILALCAFALIISPVAGAFALPISFGLSVVNYSPSTGMAFSGLNREIWLAELMEGFYADDLFLSECRDLSPFVDNDIINLAEAGVNPDVLINNTTYPVAVAERADGAIALTIDNFDTENQAVKNADLVELAYDKLASIVYGHKQALRMKIMEKAAHAIAPASNTAFTPIITTTGANDGNGNKKLTFADILKLSQAFDDAEISAEGRILVLTSQHRSDLMNEDRTLFNQMMATNMLYDFKIYKLASKRLPRYNKTTGAKVAFGAAAVPATDVRASIAFHKDEVGRAMGSETMFHSKAENDPTYRRDVIGFAKRAMVIPIRNKGVAAIYSPAAV
jgi:hypothetical protein